MASSSESAPPTNKRRRPPSPMSSQTMHDNTFYFDDGSIVLAARGDLDDEHEATYVDTPTAASNVEGGPASAKRGRLNVYFRVHRSILAGESQVFKDMFAVGQASAPTTNAEIYDGVPLVVVHDKAKDIRGFLQAIYKPSSISLPLYKPASTKLLTGPLLLAVKYQADNIKLRIIEHLIAAWPCWDYRDWKVKTAMREAGAVGCGVHISHPVDLLQLIRTVNIADCSLKKVRAVALHNMLSQPEETYSDVDTTALDARDCLALVAGQARTNDWLWTRVKLGELAPANGGIPAFDDCPRCKAKMFRNALFARWMDLLLHHPDVLVFLEREARNISEGYGSAAVFLCSYECRKDAEQWMNELAEEFYHDLVDIYDLIDLSRFD